MKIYLYLALAVFSLTISFTQGGIFRRYVRKHRPGLRLPHQVIMPRSRSGPPLIERQFRMGQFRPWSNMFVRRPRAPGWPSILYQYPPQIPFMFQQQRRASRRFRFFDRQDNRVPQFHHQPSARLNHPIGITSSTRLPTTTAVQWRAFDYGNPIDRDPTYDYAPPAVERVRFVSEVKGGARQPTARANSGMIGMYSRPSPVVVQPPWAKREQVQIRGRHPLQHQQLHQLHQQQQFQQHLAAPPPPRAAFPLWKILAHKQRRRPQRPMRPQVPPRFVGQDMKHPLYHHQVYREEAEVFPHIPNIVYFQPKDVIPAKVQHAKKNTPATTGSLKPGTVSSAELYPSQLSSSSEFKPVKATSQKPGYSGGNKDYKFTVVGYHGPAATTPMTPVAAVPSTEEPMRRPPTVLYAVKTTPETLSTTHNSAVKPLEPTESLEPEEDEAASELRPVHVLPDGNLEVVNDVQEVEDGREQGGVDVDFDNLEEDDTQSAAPVPVVPNSFNVFESLLSSFEKEFGDEINNGEDNEEDEIVSVKEKHHKQRVPVFAPAEDSLQVEEVVTMPASKKGFETSTSISVSVGVSHSSSSSVSNKHHKEVTQITKDDIEGTDGVFAIRTVPTTTTTTTSTTTTTPRPVITSTTTELTTTTTTTPKSVSTTTAYPRLPTMPTYKRKPTPASPVYGRKSSKAGGLLSKYSSSSSSASKEVTATGGVPNGSGEVVIITAGRSKVKEYKPQVIANQTHLLAFDKVVAPVDGEGVKESPILLDPSPTSTSTTKSPLEDFDAMQLLHSWLNKA